MIEALLRGALSYLFQLLWLVLELMPLIVLGLAFMVVYRQTRPDHQAAWRRRAQVWYGPFLTKVAADVKAMALTIARRPRAHLAAVPAGDDFDRALRDWIEGS